MPDNPLVAAAATHPGLEMWWDSSPLIHDAWRTEVLAGVAGAPAEARCKERLDGVWDAIVGCTTNPPLTLQVVERDPEPWAARTDALIAQRGADDLDIFWTLYMEVVKAGADAFSAIFEKSGKKLGYISGQVDPRIAYNTAKMVAQGVALNSMAPNIMIKMPGTREGILGVALLTALGIPTNATLVFTMSQILAVAEAVKAGLALARANDVDLSAWRSVCTMMLGRYEDAPAFDESAASVGVTLDPASRRWSGVAIFNRAVQLLAERGYETKMLAASMRIGPEENGKTRIWHIEKLLGQPVVLTIFPNVVEAWLEHYDGETMPTAPCMPPQETLDTLLRIPYFAEGYGENQPAAAFRDHPAVVATGTSFVESTDTLQKWVKGRIEAM